MELYLRRFSAVFAVALLFGESYVLLATRKYWPLSVDDYVAVIALLASAVLASDRRWFGLLMASWAYVFGNLYSMLFNRLDPVSGTGERIPLLAALVVLSLVVLVACVVVFVRGQGQEASSALGGDQRPQQAK